MTSTLTSKLFGFFPLFYSALLVACTYASSLEVRLHNDFSQPTDLTGSHQPRGPAGTARIWSAMQTDLVDHVYSTNASEIIYLCHFYGFSIEGPKGTTTGYAYTSPSPNGDTVPLYRLYSVGLTDHFLTTSEEEKSYAIKRRGYYLEGVLGYVYETGGTGRVPLYQLHNKPIYDHYYTTSEREREDASRNGWAEEKIIGYLLQLEDDAPTLVVSSELPKP